MRDAPVEDEGETEYLKTTAESNIVISAGRNWI